MGRPSYETRFDRPLSSHCRSHNKSGIGFVHALRLAKNANACQSQLFLTLLQSVITSSEGTSETRPICTCLAFQEILMNPKGSPKSLQQEHTSLILLRPLYLNVLTKKFDGRRFDVYCANNG